MVTTSYPLRLLSLFSQTLNVVFLNGHPDESISARSYRLGTLEGNPQWERARKTIDFLFSPFERDHTKNAFLSDYFHAKEYVIYTEDIPVA